jgi:hypothetical protein
LSWTKGSYGVGILVNSAITSHVTSATTNTTDDVSSEVTLFRAVVFAVTDSTAVLANLVFIVSECSIQSSKFAELIAFVIVLTFGSGCSLNMFSIGLPSGRNKYTPFQSPC